MRLCAAALLLVFTGCGGVPLDPVTPAGVDLSGNWVISFNGSDVVPDLRNAPPQRPRRNPRSGEPSLGQEALRIATGSDLAFIAQDFQVLRADRLEIEQGRESMGVQYTPGQYRDVSWGERQRGLWEVNAGWQEETLVVISDANDLRVVERMRLVNADELEVSIHMRTNGDERTYVRRFNRR